jgi:integrase
MATIRKRGNTYQIRVSNGYDRLGNQVSQSMTWKPAPNMTEKQVQKELQRQAVLFEEACMKGQVSSAVKFEEFAIQWFKEYAEKRLKRQTIRGYHNYEPRVYKAIGHLRLDKINTRTMQRFINDISDESKPEGRSYKGKKLSAKTIKLHLSFVSTVFDYAVKQQMVSGNPCRNVVLPSPDKKEREIYTMKEAQKLLKALDQEPEKYLKHVLFFKIAIYTGLRRGEILGLEWRDFSFKNKTVSIRRTSNYAEGIGTYTDTPKTGSSIRSLKLINDLVTLLLRFREHQDRQRDDVGEKWIENDRLFTQWNGLPMGTNTPQLFLKRLCKKIGLRYLNVHSMRHLTATLLINAGIDVKSIQNILGHSSPQTTMSLYLHSFQETQARAMEAVGNAFLPEIQIKGQTKDKRSIS